MKIKCIEANEANCLTIGKIYTTLSEGDETYTVINDVGAHCQYFKRRFEPIDEPGYIKKEEVKSMRSLRERVLGKVNYKSIAEQIWDRLEDEIIEEISYSLDEDSIVDDMIHHYKNDYIDVAKEVLIEEFCQDISSDEIEDHIKEIAREKAYE